MGVEGQVTPSGYPDPELGIETPDLDDATAFPLTYHLRHHTGPIAKCDSENCKNYVKEMS